MRLKALKYLIKEDHNHILKRYFPKKAFKYLPRYLLSLFKKTPYKVDGDFYYYGIDDIASFKRDLEDPKALLIAGFSYCHKPFECPSGRFSDNCIHDKTHPVCSQCFIGKMMHTLPEKKIIPLMIPTIHYIGEKIFETVEKHPDRKIYFYITACELTLKMFADWGNMVGVKGIGVRLSGRICNTMKAFELSEKGIKPGLTHIADDTETKMLELAHFLNCNLSS